MKTLLIASGEYVVSELAAEFGQIPPAFLPLGNRRLFERQVESLGDRYDQLILTVPVDFQIDLADSLWLTSRQVRLIRTAPTIPFIASLKHVLFEGLIGRGSLDVLYGDTLIAPPSPNLTDWLALGRTTNHYKWHVEDCSDGHGYVVWAGMFSFESIDDLKSELLKAESFDAVVERYAEKRDFAKLYCERWLDFGHVHTFYTSRRAVTTQRHFNDLKIDAHKVMKRSSNVLKMRAEAEWFEKLPSQLKVFTPNLIEVERRPDDGAVTGYATEYLALPTLSDLFVFGRLPVVAWIPILEAVDEFLLVALEAGGGAQAEEWSKDIFSIYEKKTMDRLDEFEDSGGFGLDLGGDLLLNGVRAPSVRAIAEEAARYVCQRPGKFSGFIHGDLCFSNILYDFRANRLRVIDPRGLDARGDLSTAGDVRYDIGKLAHSLMGGYDLIIAGRFDASYDGARGLSFGITGDERSDLRDLFAGMRFAGRTPHDWDCYPVMILLFLSMLPLHKDHPKRQLAFVANAVRLYQEWQA